MCNNSVGYGSLAAQFLSELDVDWAHHIAVIGPLELDSQLDIEPYEALVRAVSSQQLHAKASQAILKRFLSLYPDMGFPCAEQLVRTEPELLRACGFSTSKVATILGIAQAALDGLIPTRQQALSLSNEELITCLVTLKGVGRWTVEMLLMSTLARADILPVGDLGVREGYRRLKRLAKAPSPKQLHDIGLAWSPYRTVATRYLWLVPKDS